MNGGSDLPAGSYGYGDLARGDSWRTGEAEITAELIDNFAAVTQDRFEIHMTEEGAAAYGFRARVAHGLLILSMVDGLKNLSPVQLRAVASLDWQWIFVSPVYAGDRIHARITVRSIGLTKKPERGIVMLAFSVFNQDEVLVQTGTNQLMMLI
jgi:3-hydroxybutyryl-CoA dehydratase